MSDDEYTPLTDDTVDTPVVQTTVKPKSSKLKALARSCVSTKRSRKLAICGIAVLLMLGVLGIQLNKSHNSTPQRSVPTALLSKTAAHNTADTQTSDDRIEKSVKSPNVIWFVADDLGQSDYSYAGGEFPTPNIDALFQTGVELSSHYVQPMCSPSRHSFMSGRYPFRSGIQACMTDQITGVTSSGHMDTSFKTAANYFSDAGYDTYMYGKWHLGGATDDMRPLARGFNHQFGFINFAIDYYTKDTFGSQCYDWFNDGTADYIGADTDYSTFLILDKILDDLDSVTSSDTMDSNTDEPIFMYVALQNPHWIVEEVPDTFSGTNCELIADNDRAKYCKHVQVLDYAIGQITQKLKDTGLYENTVIAMSGDNGPMVLDICGSPGMYTGAGSAYPYRGGKYTLYQGGIKTPAVMAGGAIPKSNQGSAVESWFSGIDWIPTLLHFADESYADEAISDGIDGIDLYDTVLNGGSNPRQSLVLNIDSVESFGGLTDVAILMGDYKLIYNHQLYQSSVDGSCDVRSAKPGDYPFTTTITAVSEDDTFDNMFLFNLVDDPYEYTDLLSGEGSASDDYATYESIIDEMLSLIDECQLKGFVGKTSATADECLEGTEACTLTGYASPWAVSSDDMKCTIDSTTVSSLITAKRAKMDDQSASISMNKPNKAKTHNKLSFGNSGAHHFV